MEKCLESAASLLLLYNESALKKDVKWSFEEGEEHRIY